MIKLQFAHICDKAITDPDGKLYLLGIFSNINSEGFPAAHPSIAVVSAWAGERGARSTVQLVLVDKGGTTVFETKPLGIEIEGPQHLLISNINNLILPREGTYTFQLRSNGELVHEMELTATLKNREEQHAS